MDQRIIYTNENGEVLIIIPAPDSGLTIEEIAAKDVPTGVPFNIVDVSELPTDRHFRNAWELNGSTLSVNMAKARNIHKNNLRGMRVKKFEALDADYMKATEKGDVTAQQVIAQKKQALRDVTIDPAIDAATTPDELKAVIPQVLLT